MSRLSATGCVPPRAVGVCCRRDGFSLVEVTVAIGIFAFVVVGVLGLLPTALKQRAESSADTRAVLIVEELLASLHSATSITNVTFRDGPGLGSANNQAINLTNADGVVLGYPPQTTVPFYLWGGNRERDSDRAWVQGELPDDAVRNDIQALAKMQARRVEGFPGLYHITVQVRSPATTPLTNTTPVTFTTLSYLP